MSSSSRVSLVITSASTSSKCLLRSRSSFARLLNVVAGTSRLRTFAVVTSPPTQRTTPPRRPHRSPPRSSSSTTLVRSVQATHPSWTATPLTSPASSPSSSRRSIAERVSQSRTSPSSSSLAMPALRSSCPANPCAWSRTTSTRRLVVSLSVT